MVKEQQHPRSMNFFNQKRVLFLRGVEGRKWRYIAARVKNLQKGRPSQRQCREVFKMFKLGLGKKPYKYANCGRKVSIITPEIERFLIRTLKRLRHRLVCTSTVLQSELAREKGVAAEASTIRKVLKRNGYNWRLRSHKRKYSPADKLLRVNFARWILTMTDVQIRNYFAMSFDGVVLAVPPADRTERENFCHFGDTHVYRTSNEAASEDLQCANKYQSQLPLSRCVPMWGGVGPGGFGLVFFHSYRKIATTEWVPAVRNGSLTAALRASRSSRCRAPWRILCDNESFLNSADTRRAHEHKRIELVHVPPRSPDLNPVEMYWAWLRRQLRAKDLADLTLRRPPITKQGLKIRIRALVRSPRGNEVARNCFGKLLAKCQECVDRGGAAIRS